MLFYSLQIASVMGRVEVTLSLCILFNCVWLSGLNTKLKTSISVLSCQLPFLIRVLMEQYHLSS